MPNQRDDGPDTQMFRAFVERGEQDRRPGRRSAPLLAGAVAAAVVIVVVVLLILR